MSHRSRLPRSGSGGSRWLSPLDRLRPASPPRNDTYQAGAAIAWLPTLLTKGPQPLRRAHLRRKTRVAQPSRLHLIVLDTSGSMRQRGRLALAKGHAALLIEHAARAGDDVALLCFGGQGVELLLQPRPARAAGSARVRPLGGGGGTPLTHALAQAEQVLRRAARRSGQAESWMWLLTDGRTLERPTAPQTAQHIVIVDFDESARALGRCAAWAARWGAEHRMASQPG